METQAMERIDVAAETWPRLDFLKCMFLSREGDRREGLLLRQGKGWFHVGAMGHEALGAIAYHLQPYDYIFPYYRDRALMLARGMTNREMAMSFLGRAESNSGGRMMPGHFSSRARKIFSVATPTGSQCLPAAGAAWACKKNGSPQVVICTIGDAATRQGEFYEAICFALQERLPIVFVVEDNAYGISTPTKDITPAALGALGDSYVVHVDGRDPELVYEAAGRAIVSAREGKGPTVLWCSIDRLCSHTSSDDHRVYRPADEIECMTKRDPLALFANRLIDQDVISKSEWDEVQRAIVDQVDRDYKAAEAARQPDPRQILDYTYEDEPEADAPPIAAGESLTMVAAVNQTLRIGLERHHGVTLFGEDIADPKGGVFGLTKGLSSSFPGRVVNSPLAEASIVGLGVGMAVAGHRPIFEIQFVDFIGPGLHQLMTQAASLRWRTQGDWSCPLVLIAPYGAYLPAGALWHSQSNEGMFAHIPGIRVVIPSTPEDAAGLLWSAMRGSDPTLVLLPKHLFRKRTTIPSPVPVAPLGSAVLRREGNDVTIVAWGNCVEIAMDAATQAEKEGVSAEVLDLRSIVPCDWTAIETSVAKTGRLVVVHEDTHTAGFGQAILAEMVSQPSRFELFLAPPQLVSKPDVPVPFHPELEAAVLPDATKVLAAIRTVLE